MKKYALPLGLSLWLSACASWLPESHSENTPFKSFAEAQQAVESLVPMQSDSTTLERNGFNLAKHPNLILLTHADVVRRFLPNSLLRREDIDAGILRCLEAGGACHGIEVSGAKISRQRRGSFWADFLNFQRRTETRGWRFTTVILMVDELVVYRSWSGQPEIDEVEVTRNPLGPFQDIGPPTVNTAAGTR